MVGNVWKPADPKHASHKLQETTDMSDISDNTGNSSGNNPGARAMTMSGKPSGFRTLLGYRASRWERDYAEIELALEPKHMNSLGFTHGGLYLTLIDAAFGHAATWCPVPGNVRGVVTISLNTSFLSPAKGGIIRAVGRLEGVHDRIATVSGDVRDEHGLLLATAVGSFRYFAGSEHVEGVAELPTPNRRG
jgi:uncharacterized protein (TIGR00369 family)